MAWRRTAQAEVTASRLVWALGFHQPAVYFLEKWTLAGGAKLSIDVLAVSAQGGGKKSPLPDKAATDLLGRLELRLAQLSGHV